MLLSFSPLHHSTLSSLLPTRLIHCSRPPAAAMLKIGYKVSGMESDGQLEAGAAAQHQVARAASSTLAELTLAFVWSQRIVGE